MLVPEIFPAVPIPPVLVTKVAIPVDNGERLPAIFSEARELS